MALEWVSGSSDLLVLGLRDAERNMIFGDVGRLRVWADVRATPPEGPAGRPPSIADRQDAVRKSAGNGGTETVGCPVQGAKL